MAKSIKVMTVVGTRPEIIRLSRVMARLDEHVDHVIVHTGQNHDFELNEAFFLDLELRAPDHHLGIDTSSLGAAVGDIMRFSEEVIRAEQPNALLVLGDTNSCLCAYMARRMRVPVFHMEAGNRCFDPNVPEETNRRIIDHIADFNLVYTEHARRNLIAEGLPQRRIYLTGSPMYEVIQYYLPKIQASDALERLGLRQRGYFVVSVHREENVDRPKRLLAIVDLLNRIAEAYDVPVIVSTHPRTRKRLQALDYPVDERVQYMKPFTFTEFVALERGALCTISDSGTIAEESAILSFPAISLRDSMERPEAEDAGTIILTGFDSDVVFHAVELAMRHLDGKRYRAIPPEYQVEDTSWRVLKFILGHAKLSNRWHGIEA